MNAINVLTKDHRKVEELFSQIESGEGDRMEVFKQINDELTLHAQVEETLFYPELELKGETSEQVQHSYEEHLEAKNLLAELSAGNPDDEGWMSKLQKLKESVNHHVQEEESELFPKAEEILGEERLESLGEKIESMKKRHKSGLRAA